ncbi:MAG: hypothetical protein JWL85_491 [Candidatus Saccharibacteria bacterium]|nr:hypothetical protein [Candidatus Saccharibacteria bacterium]
MDGPMGSETSAKLIIFPLQKRLTRSAIDDDLAPMCIGYQHISEAAGGAAVELTNRFERYGVPIEAIDYYDAQVRMSVGRTAIVASNEVDFRDPEALNELSTSGIFMRRGIGRLEEDSSESHPCAVPIIPTRTVLGMYEQLCRNLPDADKIPDAVARLAVRTAFYVAYSEAFVDAVHIRNPELADTGYDDWIGTMSEVYGNPMNPFTNPNDDTALRRYYSSEVRPHRLAFGITWDLLRNSPMRPVDRPVIDAAVTNIVAGYRNQLRTKFSGSDIVGAALHAKAAPANSIVLRNFGSAIQ